MSRIGKKPIQVPPGVEVKIKGRSVEAKGPKGSLSYTCSSLVTVKSTPFLRMSGTRSLSGPRGTIVLKSTYEGLAQVDLSRMVVDEVTLVGSRCGPFGPALVLLECGHVQPEPLIARVFPLEEGIAAFELAGSSGSLKVLIEI